MLKIGILTSGGDCQALNAAMRGVAKGISCLAKDADLYGFINGYEGLIYGNYNAMSADAFFGILNQGGTILGTSRQPFKYMNVPDEHGLDKVKAMVNNYKKLKLDCLVILGGNGSQKTANLLATKGLNIIGLPKTIDNDLWGTDMSFGFYSAVEVAARSIDDIHTTAKSHGRTFIVELMGHKVGWIALYAGIAGGADAILIPEIPYNIPTLVKKLEKTKKRKGYSVIAVAEGALSDETSALPKKERKKLLSQTGGASGLLAKELEKAGIDGLRTVNIGHIQRGGSPCPYDRIIAGRFGAKAAQMIIEKDFGKLVVLKNNRVTAIPLDSTAGKLKSIDRDNEIISQAKLLGITFGEE
ncbi:MAG: 6-phosphofructokinase [Ruminococcus sp.]